MCRGVCQLTVLWWSSHTSALGDPGDVLVCESPLPPESPRIPCCFLAEFDSFKCRKTAMCISAASQRTGLTNTLRVILG